MHGQMYYNQYDQFDQFENPSGYNTFMGGQDMMMSAFGMPDMQYECMMPPQFYQPCYQEAKPIFEPSPAPIKQFQPPPPPVKPEQKLCFGAEPRVSFGESRTTFDEPRDSKRMSWADASDEDDFDLDRELPWQGSRQESSGMDWASLPTPPAPPRPVYSLPPQCNVKHTFIEFADPLAEASGMSVGAMSLPVSNFRDARNPVASSAVASWKQSLKQAKDTTKTPAPPPAPVAPASAVDRVPEESVGAKLHAAGECRPCAWFWKPMGCQNGKECQHCHMCDSGELKRRKKGKLMQFRH